MLALSPNCRPRLSGSSVQAIDTLLTKPTVGTELTGDLVDYRSYRVRRYRIIYRINEDEPYIDVYHVGHRRDVYETLRTLLLDKV